MTTDRFAVMALQIQGQPLPPLPAIAGRVFGVTRAERVEQLLAVVFGDDSEPGPVKRLHRSGALRALLDDP